MGYRYDEEHDRIEFRKEGVTEYFYRGEKVSVTFADDTLRNVTGFIEKMNSDSIWVGYWIVCYDDIKHIERLTPCDCNVETADMVNHPPHYKSESGLETIDVIEAFTSDLTGIEAVCTANVLKYVCRFKHKNGLEDLRKAQWYLNYLIKRLEKEND